jgi:hypothetical protein
MIKLKQIKEQTEFAAQIAKSNAKMDAIMAQQQKLTDKATGNFRGGDFKPSANLQDPRTQTSKSNTDKAQVKKIFDNSRNLPSSVQDWGQIKPIAEAMHTALSGLGAGDFLDQLKKIRTQTQLSALIKNWMYDGQTLFQWLEAEYTISWKQILDIIKPIQAIVGKYSTGLFDTIYENLKNKGWKISTNNVADANFMYKGMWVLRRNSPIITYGNPSIGQIDFVMENYNSLNSNSSTIFVNFDNEPLQGHLGNEYNSPTTLKISRTYKQWAEILSQHKNVYIYFLSKKYKSIVEKYFHKLLIQTYDNARKWWINKLSDKQFSRIYSKVNNTNLNETNRIIKEYKKIILSIPIETEFVDGSLDYTGVYRPYGNRIQIVCDLLKQKLIFFALGQNAQSDENYLTSNQSAEIKEILSTTCHELQHSIWNYQPLNKTKNWQQIQPYDINVGSPTERLWYKMFGANYAAIFPNEKQISSLSRRYSIPTQTLDSWVIETKAISKDGDGFYPCDINEHQSRLSQFKLEFNLKTQDPINSKYMIDAIKLGPSGIYLSKYSNWYYIIICWTKNSMTDIIDYVAWLNSELIVKQDINKSRKDNRTDFTQSA